MSWYAAIMGDQLVGCQVLQKKKRRSRIVYRQREWSRGGFYTVERVKWVRNRNLVDLDST